MIAELEKRSTLAGTTVLRVAVDWIESGGTLRSLAQDINQACELEPGEISRAMVSNYLNGLEGGKKALAMARVEGAAGLVEEAIELVDNASAFSREAIAKAKEQASLRTWLAGKWNREEFGEAKQPVVQINLGSLHLDALRSRTIEVPQLGAGEEIADIEQKDDDEEEQRIARVPQSETEGQGSSIP